MKNSIITILLLIVSVTTNAQWSSLKNGIPASYDATNSFYVSPGTGTMYFSAEYIDAFKNKWGKIGVWNEITLILKPDSQQYGISEICGDANYIYIQPYTTTSTFYDTINPVGKGNYHDTYTNGKYAGYGCNFNGQVFMNVPSGHPAVSTSSTGPVVTTATATTKYSDISGMQLKTGRVENNIIYMPGFWKNTISGDTAIVIYDSAFTWKELPAKGLAQKNNNANSIVIFQGTIYVTGNFQNKYFYKFISGNWNYISLKGTRDTVPHILCIYHDSLYAACDSTIYNVISGRIVCNVTGAKTGISLIRDMVADSIKDSCFLYIAGSFSKVNNQSINCVAKYYQPLKLATAISEIFVDAKNVVYPNPSASVFHIKGSGIAAIYDLTGRLIETIDVKDEAVFSLPYPGMYIVRLNNDYFRVVKE